MSTFHGEFRQLLTLSDLTLLNTKERDKGNERERVCVHVCVCARMRVYVCAYACVCEKDNVFESVCVCVCV